jgi:large subunit ribosomal protein LP2
MLCNACGLHYKKGHSCIYCNQIYRESDADDNSNPWIGCDRCSRWTHQKCEEKAGFQCKSGSPYMCPECRALQNNDQTGIGLDTAKNNGNLKKRRRKPTLSSNNSASNSKNSDKSSAKLSSSASTPISPNTPPSALFMFSNFFNGRIRALNMRIIAAYLLAVLGGNSSPSGADIKKILDSVGVEADDSQIDLLISELSGKDVFQVINEGKKKLAAVPVGGGGGGGAAPAAAGGAAPAAKAEEKKPEEKKDEKKAAKDEDVDLFGGDDEEGGGGGGLGGGLFGGDEEEDY